MFERQTEAETASTYPHSPPTGLLLCVHASKDSTGAKPELEPGAELGWDGYVSSVLTSMLTVHHQTEFHLPHKLFEVLSYTSGKLKKRNRLSSVESKRQTHN